VHLYNNRSDVMDDNVTAIGIDDEEVEWLWSKLVDPDGDGIAEGWIKPGAQALIDTFQEVLGKTEEKPEVQEHAVAAFRRLVATSALHDLEMDHPWVPEGKTVLEAGIDTSWSMSVTKKGRGETLAERAMESLEKALFGR
jgi:hypothetical protein